MRPRVTHARALAMHPRYALLKRALAKPEAQVQVAQKDVRHDCQAGVRAARSPGQILVGGLRGRWHHLVGKQDLLASKLITRTQNGAHLYARSIYARSFLYQ